MTTTNVLQIGSFGAALLAAFAAMGSSADKAESARPSIPAGLRVTNPSDALPASAVVGDLIARLGASAPRPESDEFESDQRTRARRFDVRVPERATGALQITDGEAGLNISASLVGSTNTPGEAVGSFVVYRRAHKSGADLVRQISLEGVEDWLLFREAPAERVVRYEIELSEGVAGLRLVSNTIEFLDHAGTPRLRIAPPWGIDAQNARFAAQLSIEGCAYDADPRPPWGRAVVAPRSLIMPRATGAVACSLQVRFPQVSAPFALDPKWTATNAMVEGRTFHSSSQLPDGRILVVGGLTPNPTASAEVFDPATDTWSATGSLSEARMNHAAVALTTGEILIVAGENPPTLPTLTELYDPTNGVFHPAGELAAGRGSSAACALKDGRVLITGGGMASDPPMATDYYNTAEVFDPASGQWSAAHPMITRRITHAAVLLDSGEVLVTGGFNGSDKMNTAELYDPVADQWTAAPPMKIERSYHIAVMLNDGRALMTGGLSATSYNAYAEMYDPSTGTWLDGGVMNVARVQHTATRVPNGGVVVAGGFNGATLASVELFDPKAVTWTPLDDLLTARVYHRASLLASGGVLVSGGLNDATIAVAGAERLALLNGTPCSSASECGSGECVDGVCCDKPCEGQCEACDGATPGVCSFVDEAPHGERPSCGAYICRSGACLSDCSSVDDCAGGHVCDDSKSPPQCVDAGSSTGDASSCGCRVVGAEDAAGAGGLLWFAGAAAALLSRLSSTPRARRGVCPPPRARS